ncbi:MAG: hypothetical protein ABIN36_19190 [Ferruginibacter sp.]
MENHKKQLEPLINWSSLKKNHKDEVTYNKIRRHLIDINDTISEDDIRNIKLFVAETEIEIQTSSKKRDINIH